MKDVGKTALVGTGAAVIKVESESRIPTSGFPR